MPERAMTPRYFAIQTRRVSAIIAIGFGMFLYTFAAIDAYLQHTSHLTQPSVDLGSDALIWLLEGTLAFIAGVGELLTEKRRNYLPSVFMPFVWGFLVASGTSNTNRLQASWSIARQALANIHMTRTDHLAALIIVSFVPVTGALLYIVVSSRPRIKTESEL